MAAILLAPGCLNPQPDDFPQNRASSPSNESVPQGPADIVPGGGTAVTSPSPQTPADNLGSAPPPAASAPDEAPTNAGADADADAGAPAPDGGLPDAAPVVVR